MDIVVSYDIADTETPEGARRLRRAAEVCLRYGQRVQFSVYECRVSPTRLEQLIGDLLDVIEPDRDSVRIYRFKGSIRDAVLSLGRGQPREVGDPWII